MAPQHPCPLGYLHLATVPRQHTHHGVHLRPVHQRHHAPRQHSHSRAHLSLRRDDLTPCPEPPLGDRRRGHLQLRKTWRQRVQHLRFPNRRLQPAPLVQPQSNRHEFQTTLVWNDRIQHHVSHNPRNEALLPPTLDLTHRRFNEIAVRDARWTRHLARPTLNAQVPVTVHLRRYPYPPLVHRLHERDPTPRRLRLQPRLKIRRAGLQTEPAVDALVHVLLTRPVRPGEVGIGMGRCGLSPRHQMPPMNRPGLSSRFGSYCCLRFRIVSIAEVDSPHTSRLSLIRVGA